MANAVLVDSSFYIGRQREGHDPFADLESFLETGDPLTCGMVTMEVLRGIPSETTRHRYRTAFTLMNFVPTTSRVWELATEIALHLDRRGTPIPPQDSIIAAHAIEAAAAVLTLDRHFRLVPKLRVLDRLT